MRLYRPALDLNRRDFTIRPPTSRPTILLVPSPGAPTRLYRDLVTALCAEGHETRTIDLPSSTPQPSRPFGTSSSRGSGRAYDARAVRRLLEQLIIQQDREVILVMHSHAHLPGVEAASGLGASERRLEGEPGGIVRLVFISVGEILGGGLMLPPSQMPMAYEVVPSSFLITRRDAVVPAQVQRRSAAMVGELVERRRRGAGGAFVMDPAVGAVPGPSVDVRELEAGHEVYVSDPRGLARAIVACAALRGW